MPGEDEDKSIPIGRDDAVILLAAMGLARGAPGRGAKVGKLLARIFATWPELREAEESRLT